MAIHTHTQKKKKNNTSHLESVINERPQRDPLSFRDNTTYLRGVGYRGLVCYTNERERYLANQ